MFNFGGMLTGAEIERQIKKRKIDISPYDPSCLNPNSYNLKLHPQLLIYKRGGGRTELLPKNRVNKLNENNVNKADYEFIDNINDVKVKTLNSNIKSYTCDEIISLAKFNDTEKLEPLDMKKDNEIIEFTIPEEGYVLQPGVLYIGRTVERTFSDKFIPMINGRSSGGRLGISIHVCAGFGDIGFNGTWTLEITAVEPVRIYANTEIAQVCYFSPYGKIKKLYRGRYYKQEDATASRFYKSKEY